MGGTPVGVGPLAADDHSQAAPAIPTLSQPPPLPPQYDTTILQNQIRANTEKLYSASVTGKLSDADCGKSITKSKDASTPSTYVYSLCNPPKVCRENPNKPRGSCTENKDDELLSMSYHYRVCNNPQDTRCFIATDTTNTMFKYI